MLISAVSSYLKKMYASGCVAIPDSTLNIEDMASFARQHFYLPYEKGWIVNEIVKYKTRMDANAPEKAPHYIINPWTLYVRMRAAIENALALSDKDFVKFYDWMRAVLPLSQIARPRCRKINQMWSNYYATRLCRWMRYARRCRVLLRRPNSPSTRWRVSNSYMKQTCIWNRANIARQQGNFF